MHQMDLLREVQGVLKAIGRLQNLARDEAGVCCKAQRDIAA